MAVLGGLFYLALGHVLHARFSLYNEHLILFHPAADLRPSWSWFGSTLVTDIASDVFETRLRPAYWAYLLASVAAFGSDPYRWHLAQLACGVLTSILFYAAARRIGADAISAWCFIALFALTGHQADTWSQLALQETPGMLMTALAVWAIVNAACRDRAALWDSIALAAMTGAGLAKESFVLLIPALLLLRWTLTCWFRGVTWADALRSIRWPVTCGVIVFACEAAAIAAILRAAPGGYGAQRLGSSSSALDPRHWVHLLATSGSPVLAEYLLVAVAAAVALSVRGIKARGYVAASIMIGAAWVIPQLVLYNQGLTVRYLFPAMVAAAAMIALVLAWLRRSGMRVTWAAGVLSIIPAVLTGMNAAASDASRYTAETIALDRMKASLVQDAPRDRFIVIAADPGRDYEASFSLFIHLKAAGLAVPAVIWPIVPDAGYADVATRDLAGDLTARLPTIGSPYREETGERAGRFYANLPSQIHVPIDAFDARRVGKVIVLTSPGASPALPSWFAQHAWSERSFTEPYDDVSLWRGRRTKAGEITFSVMTPGAPALEFPRERPLVTLEPQLAGSVGVNPWTPPTWWRVVHGDHDSQLWLGHGLEHGLRTSLWAASRRTVLVTFDVAPGPDVKEQPPTLEFALTNANGTSRLRHPLGSASPVTFPADLEPGRNDVQFGVPLDHPDHANPNDTSLFVHLRHVSVAGLP